MHLYELYWISIKLSLLAFKFHLHPVFHLSSCSVNEHANISSSKCYCFAKQQEDVRHLWFTDWWQCLHNGKSALSAHTIIMWMMLDPCLCMCFSMITTESTFFLSNLPFSAQSLKHQGGESERKTKKREEETPAVPQVFLRRVSVVIQCLREACGRLLMWFYVRFCVTTHSISIRWTTTGNTNPALFVYSQI